MLNDNGVIHQLIMILIVEKIMGLLMVIPQLLGLWSWDNPSTAAGISSPGTANPIRLSTEAGRPGRNRWEIAGRNWVSSPQETWGVCPWFDRQNRGSPSSKIQGKCGFFRSTTMGSGMIFYPTFLWEYDIGGRPFPGIPGAQLDSEKDGGMTMDDHFWPKVSWYQVGFLPMVVHHGYLPYVWILT